MKNKENYLVHYLKIIAKLTKSCIAWKSLLLLAVSKLEIYKFNDILLSEFFRKGKAATICIS